MEIILIFRIIILIESDYRLWHLGRVESIKFLIRHGANVNARMFNGETALILATKNRNAEAVRVLIEHGADINAADYQKKKPIDWAIKNDDAKVTKVLLENGIENPLHPAVSYVIQPFHSKKAIKLKDFCPRLRENCLFKI